MSNFPLSYKLSWPQRFLKPSVAGSAGEYASASGRMMEAPRERARLVFLGDISAVANRTPPEIDTRVREIIGSADLVVANCESPVVARPKFPLSTRLGGRHAMTPAFLDGVMTAAGIDPKKLVLSLANNHALDQGVEGFEETVAALGARGIRTAGTAADELVRQVRVGPLTLGLLAFTQWRNAAEADFSGRVTMQRDIAGWRGDGGGVDLLCAIPHWDFEFRHFPRDETRAMARRLVERGVGLIAGHHAHVVQPAERMGGALVAHGLGDFLGTALPRQPWPGRIGVILVADIGADPGARGGIASYRFFPFLRIRQRRNERLTPLDTVEGPIGRKANARLAAIFGERSGGQASEKPL
jgi:poly-gamma-glutamate synthesis protein (capsule biosynthesis protein)